jgi:hypothetical protein
MKSKKPKPVLPRLLATYSAYALRKGTDGELHWVGKVIEVEVVTLHL